MCTYTVGGSKRVPDTEQGTYICMYVKIIMQECSYKCMYIHMYVYTYIAICKLLLTEKFIHCNNIIYANSIASAKQFVLNSPDNLLLYTSHFLMLIA